LLHTFLNSFTYSMEEMVELLAKVMSIVPLWVRILRDILAKFIEAGVKRGDLRGPGRTEKRVSDAPEIICREVERKGARISRCCEEITESLKA